MKNKPMKEWQLRFLEFYRLLLPNWANNTLKDKWFELMNQIYNIQPRISGGVNITEDKIWFRDIEQFNLVEMRGFILYEQTNQVRIYQEDHKLIIIEDLTKQKREKISMGITKAEARMLFEYINKYKDNGNAELCQFPDLLFTLYDEIVYEFPEFKQPKDINV